MLYIFAPCISYTQTQALGVDHTQREFDDQNYLAAIKVVMALVKSLCTFLVAILVILSAGDSLAAVAARPIRLHGADTEALLRERGGRRQLLTRRDAETFRASKGATRSDTSNSGNNAPKGHP